MRAGHHRAGTNRRTPRRAGRRGRQSPPRTARVLILALTLALAEFLIWQNRDALWPGPGRSHHLSMDEARAANAALPFAGGPLRPPRRYIFHGTPAAREQATDCLATAALYEAGDDDRGQRAVMQVVLNRLRNPAFPKTVCGVVYQGASRLTGCQFSFTCDGSRWRRRQREGWAGARRRATRALGGAIFRPVGNATHYHADWVFPNWAASLVKVAQIRTHIFYRAETAADRLIGSGDADPNRWPSAKEAGFRRRTGATCVGGRLGRARRQAGPSVPVKAPTATSCKRSAALPI